MFGPIWQHWTTTLGHRPALSDLARWASIDEFCVRTSACYLNILFLCFQCDRSSQSANNNLNNVGSAQCLWQYSVFAFVSVTYLNMDTRTQTRKNICQVCSNSNWLVILHCRKWMLFFRIFYLGKQTINMAALHSCFDWLGSRGQVNIDPDSFEYRIRSVYSPISIHPCLLSCGSVLSGTI